MNFKVWLYCILMNIYINLYCKVQCCFQILDDQDVEDWQIVKVVFYDSNGLWFVELEVLDGLFDQQILDVLDGLLDEFCQVVLLVDVEGFVYKEIVEIMGILMGIVMSWLNCVCKQLCKQLVDVVGV